MALVIGLLLLVALFSSMFRLGRAADHRLNNPVLRRLEGEFDPDRLNLARLKRDMAQACREPESSEVAPLESAAEAREADLCRQLVAGTISAISYRQFMSELARDGARAGGEPR